MLERYSVLRVITARVMLVSAVVIGVGIGAPGVGATAPPAADCDQHITISVRLAPDQAADQTIAGTLCQPHRHRQGASPDARRAGSVDVLVHGATYDRNYWDFPYQNYQHSYARRAVEAGRTVFFYDRVGNGKSSRVDSTKVGMETDAYALHQVITYLREHKHYRTVNVVGHSFGSLIGVLEASEYADADRLVVTGSLQSTGPALINGLVQVVPAEQVPQFAGTGYDDGWQTGKPGTKGAAFYNLATADPGVIAYDEAHQGVVSNTQLAEGRVQRVLAPDANPTSRIKVPVLLVIGEHDGLYCGLNPGCANKQAILDFERPYYAQAKRLDAVIIPGSGHDINLNGQVGKAVQSIDKWLKTTPAR